MKTKYKNLLKKEEWKTFRSRILELDNYTCTKCNTCCMLAQLVQIR